MRARARACLCGVALRLHVCKVSRLVRNNPTPIPNPSPIATLSSTTPPLPSYLQVKFLVTFLSRNNQHEACVLANKFRNLHLYGCWWYCNNPSIIREVT